MTGETETRADRRGHARLRKVAGEWFPTIAVDMLDRIVAAAWIDGRSASGGSAGQTAIVAAAAVRRDGLRALRGEEVDLPPDAEERIAALTSDDPGAPGSVRGHRFRRRARPEAHGRRTLEAPAEDDPRPAATATLTTELRAVRLATAGATAPAPGLPAPAPVSPVPASATAAPTAARAAARRPAASQHRTNARRLRRALPFVALIAVAVGVVALVSSIAGKRDAASIALVRAPSGASEITAVLQTTAAKAQAAQKAAAKTQAAQKAAARRAAHRRAAARAAKRRAAHRRAAKRRAAAPRSTRAKPRAVQRRLPPARSVPPPAAPTPQPTHHAPSPRGGGGSWGGEFGP